MTEVYPEALENKLDLTLERLARDMMCDELVGGIVNSQHRRDPSILVDFPNFTLIPTLQMNDNGSQVAGIDIMHSYTHQDMQYWTRLYIFDRIPLATLSISGENDMVVAPRFAQEIRRLGIDPSGPQPLDTMRRWQTNWQQLMQAMHGEVEIDPISDRVILTGVLNELPGYFRTHDWRQAGQSPYDFQALATNYNWMTNLKVPTDLEENLAFRKAYCGLQAVHGPMNVRYALGAYDTETGDIRRIPGYIGLYSPKVPVQDVPFEYAFTLERGPQL
jgi:hypothetical protein